MLNIKLFMKSRRTPIDYWVDEVGFRHVIYFDDDYRVRRVMYDLEGTVFQEYDEIDDPSLSDYRVVLENVSKEKN